MNKAQYTLSYTLARYWRKMWRDYSPRDCESFYLEYCRMIGIAPDNAMLVWSNYTTYRDSIVNPESISDQMRDRVMERWTREYTEEHNNQDWKEIIEECKDNAEPEEYDDNLIGRSYLGSCLTLSPSGKYYLPYACSNVTEVEALRDQCWYAALDSVAESHGGWIESGDGDPTDIYFCMRIE